MGSWSSWRQQTRMLKRKMSQTNLKNMCYNRTKQSPFFAKAMYMAMGGSIVYKVCSNIMKKSVSATSALKARDFAELGT
eukprot:5413139-Ditylum_brightwellii.AAC.1